MTHLLRQFAFFATAMSAVLLLQISPVFAQIRITDDGIPTTDDLLQAEKLVSQCLGTTLSVDSNQASQSGDRIGVAFHPHDTGPGLQRFYVAILKRDDVGEDWGLQILRLHAAQYLTDGKGVHVTGLVDPQTAESLYQSVGEFWKRALGPDFTITTINSTSMPETYCDYSGKREVEGVWYEVLVTGRVLPDEPVLPKYLYALGIVDIGGTDDRARMGEYKFNFREDENGNPEFVSVECAFVPTYLCNENLEALKTALGITGEEDTTQRDAAITAVLPAPYTNDHIGEIQNSTGNGQEILTVNLADVPASASRTVRGIVICRRPLGSGADWGCEYRFVNYNQVLANGMTVSVRSLNLNEAQVETMVKTVESDIANARIISITSRDAGFSLRAMGPGFPGFTASFNAALTLTEEEFRE